MSEQKETTNMVCSECNGEVISNCDRSKLICKNCGRTRSYNQKSHIVEMGETSNYDQTLME